MPVVGIAGIGDEQVGAVANGLSHAGVQLAGGRLGEAQLQFGVLAHTHHAPIGVHATLQVVAEAEGIVLEARARQRGALGDATVEA
ncbi:hypothetical protein D9M71_596540 [compost metagenome]